MYVRLISIYAIDGKIKLQLADHFGNAGNTVKIVYHVAHEILNYIICPPQENCIRVAGFADSNSGRG